MSTKIDNNGRRFVQSEAIVPGTPEQVWQAIASGPGVSSWFVPCQIEERTGGKIVATFGPGMDSEATITAWNPPQGFSAEGSEIAPGAPIMATEWTVEALGGGSCRVRVVHSWFAESDEWDSQFEGTEHGWPAFFRDLAVYLVHFDGQPSATYQTMAMSADPQDVVWNKLAEKIGFIGKSKGEIVACSMPPLNGTIEYVGPEEHPECLIRMAGGFTHFFAIPMGGMACLSVRTFCFGDYAKEAAEREESAWTAWLSEQFPMPSDS